MSLSPAIAACFPTAALAVVTSGWQAELPFLLAPLVLFAVIVAVGLAYWRTRAGKVMAIGGFVGGVLWLAGRLAWVIAQELGSVWRNGCYERAVMNGAFANDPLLAWRRS